MKNLRFYISLILLGMLAIACRNDFTEEIETNTESHEPMVFVSTSFNGFVFDEEGNALESVRISINSENVYTDSRGFFQISQQVNSTGAYIRAYLDGYFEAYGNVVPSADNTGHIRFTLKERTPQGVIDSNSDTKISLDNGSEITFKANSFIDENGNAYQGEVTVYADYIDPSNANFGAVMPGDLSARSVEGESVILQSFGMLNVELESESGEQLQINQKAIIKVKVPDANLAIADASIPLWYFDTSDGLWKEEGSALLNNGYYTGEVTHFTLWNCDVPFPHVLLTGNIYSRGPLPFYKVKITWVETGEMRTTYTDDEGNFSGKVPSNASLLIEIIDDCGEVIYSEEVETLTENIFVSIGLGASEYDFFTLTGTLVCNGELMSNGYVLIDMDNEVGLHFAVVDAQGNFTTELLNCNSSNLTITGIDAGNNEQGDPQTFPIESEMSIDQLSACGNDNADFKAVFTFNNQIYVILNPVFDSIVEVTEDESQYLITTTDVFESNESVIQHIFSFLPNDRRFVGFSMLSFGEDNYRAKVKDGFEGTPESFQFVETDDYIEFFVPNAEILYLKMGGSDVIYDGTFYIKAQK